MKSVGDAKSSYCFREDEQSHCVRRRPRRSIYYNIRGGTQRPFGSHYIGAVVVVFQTKGWKESERECGEGERERERENKETYACKYGRCAQ